MTDEKSNHRMRGKRSRREREGHQTEMVIMTLADGDKTLTEIADQFFKLTRRFGYFFLTEEDEGFHEQLRDDIELLKRGGLLVESEGL